MPDPIYRSKKCTCGRLVYVSGVSISPATVSGQEDKKTYYYTVCACSIEKAAKQTPSNMKK